MNASQDYITMSILIYIHLILLPWLMLLSPCITAKNSNDPTDV